MFHAGTTAYKVMRILDRYETNPKVKDPYPAR